MNYISKVTLPNNSTYKIKDNATLYYAVCSTTADTAIKQVTINEFEQEIGVMVKILFQNINSAASPQLQVNSNNPDSIYLNEGNVTPWNADEVVSLVWDGTYWRINDYSKIEVIRL